MGYWDTDYEPKDTDILCAFRITPQPGVDPIEAAARVAGESSTATWTVVWTEPASRPTSTIKAKAYQLDAVPGIEGQYIARIAYDIDLFEEGLGGEPDILDHRQRLRLQGAEGVAARGHADPAALTSRPFQGPPQRDRHGARVPRQVRASAARATTKPKLGLSAKNYGARGLEGSRGGLDFTKDDENINSQPFMALARELPATRSRPVNRASAATGEIRATT